MKKKLWMSITDIYPITSRSFVMRLAPNNPKETLPEILPGQFVEIRVPTAEILLRRPISVFDVSNGQLSLMIQEVGRGTKFIGKMHHGDVLDVILPLGDCGFSLPKTHGEKPLLIGGGVGIAPLFYLGKCLAERGIRPTFLFGGRSATDLPDFHDFSLMGDVYICTDDGSLGHHGLVTTHLILKSMTFHRIYTCGPTPMMKAVTNIARESNIPCEVSLENHMACGIGACLCCVTKTKDGHNRCVCKEGPVFNAFDVF